VPTFSEVADGLQMPLAEAMATQRAVRRLRVDPIDDETVLELLRLAVRAPSAGDGQHWEFVVVRDPDVKHQLARLNRQAWSIGRRRYGRKPVDEATRKTLDAVQWQADHFEDTPVVIVACLRGKRPRFPAVAVASWYGSVFPAVQNLLLAARALGLGAALTTMPVWSTTLTRRTLGLPGSVHPVAAIPLGWPKGHYGPSTRAPVEPLIHLDRYGNRPFTAVARATMEDAE
jgi:nitroreductase